jgi:transposase
MANQTIPMAKIRQILRYYSQGKSKLQIAELTSVSRNTLKKYIRRFKEEKYSIEQIESFSDQQLEDIFTPAIDEPLKADHRFNHLQTLLPSYEKLMKKKGMSLQKLWEEYIKEYPNGYKSTQFHHYYQRYVSRANPVMVMQHKAGDKMYIDFAGDKLSIVDKDTGEIKEVEVFIAVLGCSQLTYLQAVESQKKEHLIEACENALHYFGGVPAAVVPDNLKSAVTKSSKYEPKINELFADFAQHYGMAVLPARAYKPKDKALVEGMVKIVYNRIYYSIQQNIYPSIGSLNQKLLIQLEELNNAPFKGRDYSRRQQFIEIEQSSLQPLPEHRYECRHQKIATVMKNGHVCLTTDKHYYSVPYAYIGKKVKILYSSLKLDIYYKYECIATHPRNQRKYQYTTLNEHLASSHRYITEWSPEHFINQALEIDKQVADYICKVLELKQHPEQAYKSCSGILNLGRKAGKERLIKACRRASSFGIYNYPIIVEILEKNFDQLELDDEIKNQNQMPDHDNIRGAEYYQ